MLAFVTGVDIMMSFWVLYVLAPGLRMLLELLPYVTAATQSGPINVVLLAQTQRNHSTLRVCDGVLAAQAGIRPRESGHSRTSPSGQEQPFKGAAQFTRNEPFVGG